MFQVSPAILESEKQNFTQKLKKAIALAGAAHIDVVDRTYADTSTLQPEEWGAFPLRGRVSVHLMVSDPLHWLGRIDGLGIKTTISQIEDVEDWPTFESEARRLKMDTGLAVNLETPIEVVTGLKNIPSTILLMAVAAGCSGQEFNNNVLPKISYLRKFLGENAEILVDGGINLKTAKLCKEYGASGVVVNTYLWENFEANLNSLRRIGVE